MAERVADAQPGQPVGLGERAGDDEVREALDQRRRVADPGVGDELLVGLVEHDEASPRGHLEESGDLVGADDCSGRVVRVGDEGQLGRRRHRVGERGQIEGLRPQRDAHLIGLDQPGEHRIRLERRPAHRDRLAAVDVRQDDLLEDARRPGPNRHVRLVEAEPSGDGPAQRGRPMIGVERHVLDAAADRACHRRKRPERKLVRRHLHRVEDAVLRRCGRRGSSGRVTRHRGDRWSGTSCHPPIIPAPGVCVAILVDRSVTIATQTGGRRRITGCPASPARVRSTRRAP